MNKLQIIAVFLLSIRAVFSQELLTVQNASEIALKNNYNINISKNSVKISKNNASIYNKNKLPTVSLSGGMGFDNKNSKQKIKQVITSQNGLKSNNYNAQAKISYRIFDGFGRKYNSKSLDAQYDLSKIKNKQDIEKTLLSLHNIYYNIANLENLDENNKKLIEVSKNRLLRVQYKFEYGQSTKLELLNAEVDLNNDKIKQINILEQLKNLKNQLNLILGRDIDTKFVVEKDVVFDDISYEKILSEALKNNYDIQISDKNIEISKLGIKSAKSNKLPKIDLSGTYVFGSKNFYYGNIDYNVSNGYGVNANLFWNIFDGGRTKTAIDNAKINIANQSILKENAKKQLELSIKNKWNSYQNAKFILAAQNKNMDTSKLNFDRTHESFKVGKATSLEFRQAQINYFFSINAVSKAKYDAKILELELMYLSGNLTY